MGKRINKQTKPQMFSEFFKRQEHMDKEVLKLAMINSEEKLLSMPRNDFGLIDIDEAIKRGEFYPIANRKPYFLIALIDTKTGLVYRFKYNNDSDIRYDCRKEIYATLISRMVAKIGKTVKYYPAETANGRGVLSLDWSNGNKHYLPLSNFFEFESLKDIEDFESIDKYICKKAQSSIKKVPQHLLAGNADFIDRNIAVRKGKKGLISDTLYFDYGFSPFAVIESQLINEKRKITKSNIKNIYKWDFLVAADIGMGANYNLGEYFTTKEFAEDFMVYAYENEEFNNNIKDALNKFTDAAFVEEIKKMRANGIVFPDKNELIVRTLTEENTRFYEYSLQN